MAALAMAFVALATACGADDVRAGGTQSSSAGPAESARYSDYLQGSLDPSLPDSLDELAPYFQSDVAALGVRLTRGAMFELKAGPHLQLYVQPNQASSPRADLDRLVALARVIAPAAFARWPTLATFDLCQEPFGAASSPSTAPVTVLFLTRQQVDAVPWPTATVADLRSVVDRYQGGELTVDADIQSLPEWNATSTSSR